MKQIIQSFSTGETLLEEIPAPVVSNGNILIQTTHSLVSLGTERMLVEFGRSNIIAKARQQPDKVKQVLDKIRAEGLMPTLEAVFNKLNQPLPLGYCNVGKVIEVGDGVSHFKSGDRVVSNGHHAEFVSVPQNLVARIPDKVSDDEAVFTVIGSIGLQGIRLLNPTLGETIVVTGLGLIGLLTAQLLQVNGCRVIGLDFDQEKIDLANSWGVTAVNASLTDPVRFVMEQTDGIGADGVLITASAKSDEVISQTARMSRKRGRIVLVGVIGLNLNRAEFYEKELTFQVSCSYGPGRYDDNYEQKGIDYPLPFVRWTEKRNFEAVLESIASGRLRVRQMISEKVPLADYRKIYGNIGKSRSIASILIYPENGDRNPNHTVTINNAVFTSRAGVIGIIGAGNFTKMTMLPSLKGTDAGLKYISSAGGVTATALAKSHGFSRATTNNEDILKDGEVDLVIITTRHHLHATQVIRTLQSGKHVFVEKPLAIKEEELDAIIKTMAEMQSKGVSVTLNVGFNRRFSPHVIAIQKHLGPGPMNIIATMNAGSIPATSWVQDMAIGGGRIIGEACHYIDLCAFLTGSHVVSVCMNSLGKDPADNTDNVSILLRYADGSNAVINYFSNGNKAYAKERVEVYSRERTMILDNFRKTEGFGVKGFSGIRSSIDKGHRAQFQELIKRVKVGGPPLIPFESLVNTTRATFAAIKSMQERKWIDL
jgi:predicted dehydrogenase/threonine dehydrogenase-like Zn-dependent dehydrogenase